MRRNLSILMPFYNHGNFLSEALEPILALREYFDEFLICDDASTDGSEVLLRKYAEKYPCIRLLRNEKNLGVMGTLRRLIDEASCEYMTLPAADDVWLPEPMQKLLKKMEEVPGLDMYCADGYVFFEEEGRRAIRPPTIAEGTYRGDAVRSFRSAMPCAPSGVIVRSSLMRELLQDVWSAGCYHDGLYQLIIAQYHTFYFQAERSTVFRLSSGQFSRSKSFLKVHWDIYPHILRLLKEKYPELYEAMIPSEMFRIFDRVDYYLVMHPKEWDRHTLHIIFSLRWNRFWTRIRHNWLPRLFPESLKKKYRSLRTAIIGRKS